MDEKGREVFIGVSILVLLDTSRKDLERHLVLPRLAVSILVLLDTSRKAEFPSRAKRRRLRFNPCSSGYLPERLSRCVDRTDAASFQSLFFWIPPGKRIVPLQRLWRHSVSILVLLDTSRKGFKLSFQAIAEYQFQSLFFWIPPGKRSAPRRVQPPYPVSILVLLDTSRKAPVPGADRFLSQVSILVLLDTSRKVLGALGPRLNEARFQSLFFWIPPGKTRAVTIGGRGLRFNPCSSGYLPERYLPTVVGSANLVSILVLLDTSRKDPTSSSGSPDLRFQSLFFWIPPGKHRLL